MYYRIIRNDICRNKAVTLTTMLFIAAAALLVALAVILVVNLAGALDTLMARAKTPHFMQMHTGDLDRTRLAAFVAQNDAIAEFQILEFLNLDGAQIVFPARSLAGSVQDNGFVVQSEHFDYLLDLDGHIIQVADGSIYVPITYMQDGTARVGDTLHVAGHAFTIAGPLRDSQMQSLLSSSKRFLVSPNDFAAIKQFGSMEYLIEFKLHDLKALGAFATAYTAAGLEANGPTLTYPLFRLVNGVSDGLMIAVILLLSALVLVIAFLCIRFTLLAKIEDDYREIGVMKAIGLRVSDIKRIYLASYAALAAAGSLLGFGLSFIFHDTLLANIRLYMGESSNAALAPILGSVSVLLVFLAILVYVHHVLNRFRKIAPVQAMRFRGAQEQSSGGKHFRLSMNKLLGINLFLGIKDVLARKTLYVTMLTVLMLAAFMIIIPQNLYQTISAKSFITYMGIGNSDLRIDLQQIDNISDKVVEITAAMEHDRAIANFVVLTTKTFRARLDDGSEQQLMVELGDHAVFPLSYAAGRAPVADDEMALSVLNADELGKTVGDSLPVLIAGQERTFTVCGIYSDVTNGGKTAKAAFADAGTATMWSVINAELADPSLVEATVATYADQFAFAKVTGLESYITQTYGTTIRAIGQAAFVAAGVALLLSVLITLLFMRMLVAKDRYAIALMKAFGFTNADIQAQYIARSVCILGIGILLGTLLANTLGEMLVGALIASFGAASFAFVINPWMAYLLNPLLMVVVTLGATIAGTWDAGQISIAEHIKE